MTPYNALMTSYKPLMTPYNALMTPYNSLMTPTERYQLDLQEQRIFYDPAQEMAIKHLQRVYDELLAAQDSKPGILKALVNRLVYPFNNKSSKAVLGVYFWGGVGRGKTYLMDTFYECLPTNMKMRTHFHRFMQRVHTELAQLKNQKNPLKIVAENIANEAHIVCFDEFFVADIADAMLLAGLLETLFELGVSFVTTSNIVPDRLYENGLQRERFLPAIAFLQQHTEVVQVDGGFDYRLRALEQAEIYYTPSGTVANIELLQCMNNLAPEHCFATEGEEIEVLNRRITSKRCADDVVWFEFEQLCGGPRSANDYIELAKLFHAVLLSDVPVLQRKNDDKARRFISLVDEFYDRNVKLILSAEVKLDELYLGGNLGFEFERTRSRLLEMQSHEYLAREHRP